VIDYVNERAILGENKTDYKDFFEKKPEKEKMRKNTGISEMMWMRKLLRIEKNKRK